MDFIKLASERYSLKNMMVERLRKTNLILFYKRLILLQQQRTSSPLRFM